MKRKNSELEKALIGAQMSPNVRIQYQDEVSRLLVEKASLEQEVDFLRIRDCGSRKSERDLVTMKLNLTSHAGQIETLMQEKKLLERQVTDLEKLKREKCEIQKRVWELTQENESLKKSSQELASRFEKKLADHVQKCPDETLKELELKAARLQVVELQVTNLEIQVARIETMKCEIADLRTKVGELEGEKSSLARKAAENEVDLHEKIKKLAIENTSLTEEVTQLERRLEDQKTANRDAFVEKERMIREELNQKLVKIEALELAKNEFEGKVSSAEKLKQENEELAKKLLVVKEENSNLKDKINEHRFQANENANKMDSFPQLEAERERLRVEVTRLQEEVDETKKGVHEQRIRALDLKHELREVISRFIMFAVSLTLCLWCQS